jgi:hypothetical protein
MFAGTMFARFVVKPSQNLWKPLDVINFHQCLGAHPCIGVVFPIEGEPVLPNAARECVDTPDRSLVIGYLNHWTHDKLGEVS